MDKSTLKRFYLNECSDSEKEKVVDWLMNPQNDLQIKDWMKENWDLLNELNYIKGNETEINKIWSNIQEKIKEPKITDDNKFINEMNMYSFFNKNNYKKIISIAAIFICLIGVTTFLIQHFYFFHKDNFYTNNSSKGYSKDIDPPNNCAVLILNNGVKINLNSSNHGFLAKQGMVNVSMDSSGKINYSGHSIEKIEYNTISLPKGSKPLQLTLSDKTSVWINAASSITYPTAFTGKERRVKVNGEVYFEVAKNASMPFFVTHDSLEIKVLGTHFNVNTYEDEKIAKVTLLEGAITLSKRFKKIRLGPGDQAQVVNDEIKLAIEKVNVDEVIAWKNELFYYEGVELQTIMRQIEKYYNVEVEYKDNLNYKFFAKISRQVKLSELLKKLELTNLVHFKILENKIIVMK
ncbi:MAG: FecR family protein [Chitinophagaceae bacterium]|nr:FecR family protein [Chitinophagaceae bacterium]